MAGLKKQKNEQVPVELTADGATITLDASAWQQFIDSLESPAREIPELIDLFRAKAPWD
jgi:uncharacterized protein (DUF1778 family)